MRTLPFDTFKAMRICRKHTQSPQRAEWIGDDTYICPGENVRSFCNSHSPAQPVYTSYSPFSTRCEDMDGGADLIDKLPTELLRHVFRFLPDARDRFACASVSKCWLFLQSHMHQDEFMHPGEGLDEAGDEVQSREVACIPSTNEARVNRQAQWALGDLSRCLEGRKASDIRLAAVAVGTGACGGLGKLSLRQSMATDIGLSSIGYCCSALRTLCLWDCPNVGDEGLSLIAKGCGLLEKVDLFKCSLLGDLGLQSISKNCPLLSFLNLDECTRITDKTLIAVGEGCPNLLSLSIRSCPLIGDDGIISAMCNLKRLKRVKLDGVKVGDKSLACIGLYAKALVCLSLTNLDLVTEDGFASFSLAQGMQSLQRFTVAICKNFSDNTFAMMGKMWQGLKHVSLERCNRVTDLGLSLFMQNAACLEVLQLRKCNLVTARGLLSMFSNNYGKVREVSLKNCEGIEEVGLLPMSYFHNVSSVKSLSMTHSPGVGNVLLALVGCLCPHITSIDFSGLIGITDEGILSFLYSGRRQLACVNLSGCLELTDHSVCAIAEQCGESLKNLSLYGCRVTDRALKIMANHCIALEDLDISQCSVTDEGVTALLLKSGPTLSSLNLASCMGITDKILPLMEECCHVLSDLNLKHCQGLSQKSIDLLESKIWKCNVLSV